MSPGCRILENEIFSVILAGQCCISGMIKCCFGYKRER